MPDYSAPKLTTIIEAVRWMHEQKTKGGAVLVHCNAGRGRSVVVAIGYLLVLKEVHPKRSLNGFPAPVEPRTFQAERPPTLPATHSLFSTASAHIFSGVGGRGGAARTGSSTFLAGAPWRT